MAADSISSYGRGTQGVRVVGLKDGDAVISAARVDETEEKAQGDTNETSAAPTDQLTDQPTDQPADQKSDESESEK